MLRTASCLCSWTFSPQTVTFIFIQSEVSFQHRINKLFGIRQRSIVIFKNNSEQAMTKNMVMRHVRASTVKHPQVLQELFLQQLAICAARATPAPFKHSPRFQNKHTQQKSRFKGDFSLLMAIDTRITTTRDSDPCCGGPWSRPARPRRIGCCHSELISILVSRF